LTVTDYYRLLEVHREASNEEIKKAYRHLAKAYHPDRNRGDPDAEGRLKEINEAYQVLGDEAKRRRYDILTRQPFNRHVYGRDDLTDDLIDILGVFSRRGFGMRGFGGCRGRGYGKRGCARRTWKAPGEPKG
jgi:DnaJ-class molecular chaperone